MATGSDRRSRDPKGWKGVPMRNRKLGFPTLFTGCFRICCVVLHVHCIYHIFSLFNLGFFHIFSLFNLLDKFDQLLIIHQRTSTVNHTVRSLIHFTIFIWYYAVKHFPSFIKSSFNNWCPVKMFIVLHVWILSSSSSTNWYFKRYISNVAVWKCTGKKVWKSAMFYFIHWQFSVLVLFLQIKVWSFKTFVM